jgi:hypothetical protein
MRHTKTIAALVVLSAAAAGGADTAVDGRAALDRIKRLAGTWEGTVAKPDGPPGVVTYELTAGGNSVVEKLFTGTAHEMLTVYHLDRGTLLATHYCAMGNQPLMKLERATADELQFGFAGGTNLDPEKDIHIHQGRLRFTGEGRLESEWDVFDGPKKTTSNRFFLARKP